MTAMAVRVLMVVLLSFNFSTSVLIEYLPGRTVSSQAGKAAQYPSAIHGSNYYNPIARILHNALAQMHRRYGSSYSSRILCLIGVISQTAVLVFSATAIKGLRLILKLTRS